MSPDDDLSRCGAKAKPDYSCCTSAIPSLRRCLRLLPLLEFRDTFRYRPTQNVRAASSPHSSMVAIRRLLSDLSVEFSRLQWRWHRRSARNPVETGLSSGWYYCLAGSGRYLAFSHLSVSHAGLWL